MKLSTQQIRKQHRRKKYRKRRRRHRRSNQDDDIKYDNQNESRTQTRGTFVRNTEDCLAGISCTIIGFVIIGLFTVIILLL